MRKLALLFFVVLVLLLVACQPAERIITATPAPPTAPPDNPTPTAEFLCTPVSTDHRCFIDQVVNPNAFFDPPPLTVSPNITRYTYVHPNGSIEDVVKNVEVPGPDPVYSWFWDMTGNYKGSTILGWLPSIQYRYADNTFAANISSAAGTLLLNMDQIALQQGQNYLLKLSYRLDVFSRSGKPYDQAKLDWQEVCQIKPYNANPAWRFPVQGLNDARTSWDDKATVEEMAVAFHVDSPALTATLSCGIRLNWPAWEGHVLFKSFELIPVDWPDEGLPVIR